MKLLHEQFPLLYTVVEKIIKNNGRAYLVGGVVRDFVLGIGIKDIDVEVHGLFENQLEDILRTIGSVSTVGKSFGVLRLHGLDVDWSLPRIDSAGRKPDVRIDPFMGIQHALRRRDLTMNAMAIDMQTDELIDPFGGLADIKKGILRTPDKQLFVEDPLRFFRVMQFVGRFNMLPDPQLDDLCMNITITALSRERIEEEFRKLMLYSDRPSLGFRWLHTIGRLPDVLPELADTVGVEQNPQWHPEGDVFEHTMQALDAAAQISTKYEKELDRLVLMYAALCHDLGKVTTTTYENGVIKSIGHENESKRLAAIMMHRITHNSDLIRAVLSLVLYHMAPLQFVKNRAKLPAYKRLASKLSSSISMSFLADLCLADKQGRNGKGHEPLVGDNADVALFIERSQQAGVFEHPEMPQLKGADLLDFVNSGPRLGQLLAQAYQIQINEGVTDKAVLIRRVLGKKRVL